MSTEEEKAEALWALKEAEQALKELEAFSNPAHGRASKSNIPQLPNCSFCGKGINQVEHMVRGQGAYICAECVLKCQELINGL